MIRLDSDAEEVPARYSMPTMPAASAVTVAEIGKGRRTSRAAGLKATLKPETDSTTATDGESGSVLGLPADVHNFLLNHTPQSFYRWNAAQDARDRAQRDEARQLKAQKGSPK